MILRSLKNQGLSQQTTSKRFVASFSELVEKFPVCGERAEGAIRTKSSTSGGVVYALFFGKLSSFSTRTATTLLLKAESTMQSRLKEGGSQLQVVVCPSDPGIESRQLSEAYRSFLDGLHDHWRAVPLSNAHEFMRNFARKIPLGSAYQSNSPQLLFLDSNGRVIMQDGIRHLSLDRGAIGFPWAPAGGSAAGSRDGSVRHLLSPLTLTRAPQEGTLTTLLILPPYDHPDAMTIENQCNLIDRYREVAGLVIEDYLIPPGQTSFFYSSEREIWEGGLANLLKIGIAPSKLLFDVKSAAERGSGGGAVLVVIWSDGLKGGRTGASYVVSPIELDSSGLLESHFIVHPDLKFLRR